MRFATMIGARRGELPDGDWSAFEEHLAACGRCRARADDEKALSEMLSEALLAEANGRDFSGFADAVLERIPRYASDRGVPSGMLARLAAWARRHRAVALASALAPAMAAALVVYLAVGASGQPDQQARLDVNVGDRGAMVLETSEGPIVLLGASDSEGS